MKEPINIWGIKEFDGDGISCPIIPANLPWYKKVVLMFFRFGVCPICVTMSLTYSIRKRFQKLFIKKNSKKTYKQALVYRKRASDNMDFVQVSRKARPDPDNYRDYRACSLRPRTYWVCYLAKAPVNE